MKAFFDDAEMDAQLQRTLTAVPALSADLGQAYAVAARVTPGDYDSWFAEWSAEAERAEATGAAAEAGGHRVSARQAFLRATEYWRQAIFFIRHDLDDERLQRGWRAHRAAFRRAIPHFDAEVTVGEIAVGGARLAAYRFRAERPIGPASARPVVLLPCGYDSTAEAGYAATAAMALRHGYDAVTFEGPGQGGVLYDQRIPMRPDFESVLPAVVDWVLAQPDVDPTRLVLMGRSFAGYLAPRGASGEPRLAALVCDPGQYDFVSRLVGPLFDEAEWQRLLAGDPELDAQLDGMLADPHGAEWYGARMATMGAARMGDFLRMQVGYTLEGRVDAITCPVLVTEGEGDFASQSQQLVDALGGRPTFLRFSEAEGGGGHCEGMGATLFEEAAFDWLDDTLGLTR